MIDEAKEQLASILDENVAHNRCDEYYIEALLLMGQLKCTESQSMDKSTTIEMDRSKAGMD